MESFIIGAASAFLFSLVVGCVWISSALFKSLYWYISPVVVLCGYYLLREYIGVVLYSFQEGSLTAVVSHVVFYIGVFVSVFISSLFFRRQAVRFGVDQFSGANRKDNLVVLFFVILGVLSVLATFFLMGRVPLFYLFSDLFGAGSDISMHSARQMNTLNHASGDTKYFGQGYLRLIYTEVAPLFVLYLYLRMGAKEPVVSKALVSILFLVFVFGAALNGQIWVPAQIIFLFIIAYLYRVGYVYGNGVGPVIRRAALYYLILLSMVFVYRYGQYLSGRYMEEGVFLNTLNRIYGYPAGALFDLFPNIHDFRYGSTWVNNLMGLLPSSVQSFSYEVHNLVYQRGWGYTLSPGIVGSAYVNFGLIGTFLTGLVLSLVFSGIYKFLIDKASFMALALAIYLSHGLAMGFTVDIHSFVIRVITLFAIYSAYVISWSALKIIRRRFV